MPSTQLIDWNLPLVPAVAQRLIDRAEGEIIDLSSQMVLVPTVQSGRRLLERLALSCAGNQQGLLPPRITTPDQFLQDALKDQKIATEAEVLASWMSVFASIRLRDYIAVFPVEPPVSNGWLLSTAQRFKQLRDELGGEGMDIAEAASKAAEAGQESERWEQLARLEACYYQTLKGAKRLDPIQARKKAATHYAPPKSIERIILVATVDPQPLPLKALQSAEQSIPVEIWAYGGDPEAFDVWGRPVTEFWIQRPLKLENWDCQIHTLATPKQCAVKITTLTVNKAPESLLLGLADPQLTSYVETAFHKADIPCYNPKGQALNQASAGRLAELLCLLSSTPDITTIRSLLQHPDFYRWLGCEQSQSSLLQTLDRIFEKHLAPEIDSLLHFANRQERTQALAQALQQIQELIKDLRSAAHFSEALAIALEAIYKGVQRNQTEGTVPINEQAKSLRLLLEHTGEAEAGFKRMTRELARSTLLQRLATSKIYPDRASNAHDLLGWLELLWNDAPHLVIAGLNEGIVPESVNGDAFLPEVLRETLGLRTNQDRFARDAYLLEALCRRRVKDGRIDLLIPQVANDGSPLKPSRLLFQAEREQLLPRVRTLFQGSATASQSEPYTNAWKLVPPQGIESPKSLSVSALKNYLQCPFRFFLKHLLKMQPLDVANRELSPAAFGNLFHDTVEILKGREFTEALQAKPLLEELQATADQLLRSRYGNRLSFALRLQREALMSRIQSFVRHQIEDIQNTGRIIILDTENAFEVAIDQLTIRGRIDRIDLRGDVRELIDYKTSDTATTPTKAHLALVGKKAPPAHLPEAAYLDMGKKTYRWTDLQLPLYVKSQQSESEALPQVAYFNLAKTLEKSGLSRWDDFSQEQLDSAQTCATAIVQQIQAGVF
ncbi:MAG: PD-(D/E)XK nuclease family protein [Verrucomicrobiota bacterium]